MIDREFDQIMNLSMNSISTPKLSSTREGSLSLNLYRTASLPLVEYSMT